MTYRNHNPGYKCDWCDVSTAKRKLKDGFCGYCYRKHKRESEVWRVAEKLMMPIVKTDLETLREKYAEGG